MQGVAACPRQPNSVLVDATALPWGVTSTQVWLDITTLWVQSNPQRWALLLASACHPLWVLAVP